jgi:GNAT superfamily N-acetyltransferase
MVKVSMIYDNTSELDDFAGELDDMMGDNTLGGYTDELGGTMRDNSLPKGDVDGIYQAFEQSRLLNSVQETSEEMELWRDNELALLAENDFNTILDPLNLSLNERQEWINKIYNGRWANPLDIWDLTKHYWLMERASRIGIIGIRVDFHQYVKVISLYVQPEYRGNGIADKVLKTIYQNAICTGFHGIQLGTQWKWQQTLKYYLLKRRMWVKDWMFSITLQQSTSLPEYSIRNLEKQMEFLIRWKKGWKRLYWAQKSGKWLRWRESSLATEMVLSDQSDLLIQCATTFSMHLALQNWPLVRSREDRARNRDFPGSGYPEGLAESIGCRINGNEIE